MRNASDLNPEDIVRIVVNSNFPVWKKERWRNGLSLDSGLGLYNLLLRFFAECYIKSKYVCVKKYCLNQTLGFIVLVM